MGADTYNPRNQESERQGYHSQPGLEREKGQGQRQGQREAQREAQREGRPKVHAIIKVIC